MVRSVFAPACAVALLALPASGDEETPVVPLPRLKQERDRAWQVYTDAVLRRERLEAEERKDNKALKLAKKQALDIGGRVPGFFRDRDLDEARREQKRVGNQLARTKTLLRDLEDDIKVLRHDAIKAMWPYIYRKYELAERSIATSGPSPQSRRRRQGELHAADADAELERVAHLERLGELEDEDPEPTEPELAPVETVVSLAELQEMSEFYEKLAGRATERVSSLEPYESKRQDLVQRLDGLRDRGYSMPGLGETIQRELTRLERTSRIRRRAQSWSEHYQQQIQRIQARMDEVQEELSQQRERERVARERKGK